MRWLPSLPAVFLLQLLLRFPIPPLGQNVHTTVHSTFHKNIPSPKDTALHLQNNSHKTACTFKSTIQHFDNSDCETLCNLHYFGDFTV